MFSTSIGIALFGASLPFQWKKLDNLLTMILCLMIMIAACLMSVGWTDDLPVATFKAVGGN